MKDRNSGRERDCNGPKERESTSATVTASSKFIGSPPKTHPSSYDSASNKEDQNHRRSRSREREDSAEAHRSKKHKKSKKKKKSKDKDRHRESRSSDDSDRDTKKKKKKRRRQRDSEAEQHSPRSYKNRSSEERESHKRHYDDYKNSKHDDGYSPEKRRRIDHMGDNGDHQLPSHHALPTNDTSPHRLNGFTGNGYSQTNGDSHGFSGGLKH